MELAIEDLACRRAGRAVFAGLTLAIAPGEAMALRGPNGVGKSSLLRVLAGFVPPAAGDARLGGVSLAGDRQAFQERVAYAGHLDAVKPALSVRGNLSLWAGLFGAGEARVTAALERFGLGRIAARSAAECSAGQRRRLGLARLCLTDRPLWLLDEPTVSLDAASTAAVAELIRGHVAGGGLALVATHLDLGLGEVRAHEMTAMTAGEVSALSSASLGAGAAGDPFLDGTW